MIIKKYKYIKCYGNRDYRDYRDLNVTCLEKNKKKFFVKRLLIQKKVSGSLCSLCLLRYISLRTPHNKIKVKFRKK